MEDEPVSLSCGYRAMDPPISQVHWLKDGEPLKESGGPTRQVVTGGPGKSTLQIKSVHLADKGGYHCEILTQGHEPVKSQVATLNVLEKLKFSPEPVDKRLELNSTAKVRLVLRHYLLNWTGEIGSSLWNSSELMKNFYIRRSRARLKARIHRLSSGTKSGTATAYPRTFKTSTGPCSSTGSSSKTKATTLASPAMLRVRSTRPSSSTFTVSLYTCISLLQYTDYKYAMYTDRLLDRSAVAPKFVVKPANTTAVEGMPVLLHCSVEGDPKPAIQWDKDSRMNNLNDERFQVMPNGTLAIKEVYISDEGIYGCMAGNSGGLKREEAYLTVKGTSPLYNVLPSAGNNGRNRSVAGICLSFSS